MNLIRRLLREPLTHFVLLGGLLFAAYSMVTERDTLDADERLIQVDRAALITFLQYRSAAFEPSYFEAQYDALSPEQIAELARNYVREEAMAREARALGLDQNDYVIQRRLVQKIEYLVTDADLDPEAPSEEDLRAYFDQHADDFRQEAQFTFTHVFADAEKPHAGGAQAYAEGLLRQLRADNAGFNDAPAYGDRFPYQRNYVGKGLRPIANEFGPQFAAMLAALPEGDNWQGPIASNIGYHLVLLTSRSEAREPQFEELRSQILTAVIDQRHADTREMLLDELVDQYDVRFDGVELDQSALGSGGS